MSPGLDLFSRLVWVLTLLSSLLGGAFLLSALFGSNGAPQQAAGAAVAVGFAVLPYVFARAFDEILRDDPRQAVTGPTPAGPLAVGRPWPRWVKRALLGGLLVVAFLVLLGFAVDWWYHPEAYPFGGR